MNSSYCNFCLRKKVGSIVSCSECWTGAEWQLFTTALWDLSHWDAWPLLQGHPSGKGAIIAGQNWGPQRRGRRPLAWCVTLSWCPIYHEWEVLIPLFVLCLNVMNQCAAQINWNSSLLTLPDVVLIYLFNGSCWEIILSWYESQCKTCRRRKDCVCKGTAFSLPWRIFEVRKKYDKYRENLWDQV